MTLGAVLPLPARASETSEQLDRGHRILIQRGFQLQSLTFGLFEKDTHAETLQHWNESNYTSFHTGVVVPKIDTQGDTPQLWGTWKGNLQDPTKSLPEYVFQSKQIEGLINWQYRDEQNVGDPIELERLQTWMNFYRPKLPNTLLYTNQHGDDRFRAKGSVTDSALTAYMRQIKPDMLMNDTYPYGIGNDFLNMGGRPRQFYYALNRYRKFALAGHDGTGRHPIPYGAWIQTFKGRQFKRFPSTSEISLQQFAALTFGCKLVSSFTYNNAEDVGKVLESPLFEQPFGRSPTAVFEHVKDINRQTLNLGKSLVYLISTDIKIVPQPDTIIDQLFDELFERVETWQPSDQPYVTQIQVKNLGPANRKQVGDVLVGQFKPLLESFDGPATNQHYWMVTNGLASRSHSPKRTRQAITLDFDFSGTQISALERLNRQSGNVERIEAGWQENITNKLASQYEHLGDQRYRLTLILNGGEGDLFKFATGAPFVGLDQS